MDRSKRSEKEQFWRLILAEQQASGLSARAFCIGEGISESQFYNWRSKLAARDRQPTDSESDLQLIPVAVTASPQASGEVSQTARQVTTGVVEIQTPRRFVLRVSEHIASGCLGRLLSVVVGCEQQLEGGAETC